ncbi:MAG: FeoB-associated Cys-rich membrane protein [Bacteroidaceae bacterium]|nr:FeoB-associated Cys-rich membrane protein [Bacteroidaceae bacterium]
MEEVIVYIIIALAIAYVVFRLYRRMKPKNHSCDGSCHTKCDGCPLVDKCDKK